MKAARAAFASAAALAVLATCGARSGLPVPGESTTGGASSSTGSSGNTSSSSSASSASSASSTSSGGSLTVTSIALGYAHGCALISDGTARCWGEDASGQLGDAPSSQPRLTPAALASPTGITALAGGLDQTCAVLQGGALQCWGGNDVGQSGAGMTSSNVPPTTIGTAFARVSAGFDYSCGVRTDGTAACWGASDHGQLGNGVAGNEAERTPTTVQGAAGLVSISACEYLTCGMTSAGGVLCWGLGPVGDGTVGDQDAPVAVQGLPTRVTDLAVGGMHACAVLEDAKVACWGYGGYGELGLGTGVTSAPLPVVVPGASGTSGAQAIASGEYHSCALLIDGTVTCWGNELAGSQGSFVPVPVAGVSGAVAIAAGESFDCALLASGEVVCWGDDGAALGDGATAPSTTPVRVLGLP